MLLIPLSLLFHLSGPNAHIDKPFPLPVATFSIVGYDAETGDLGIAVQSISQLAPLYRGLKQVLGRLRPNPGQTQLTALTV